MMRTSFRTSLGVAVVLCGAIGWVPATHGQTAPLQQRVVGVQVDSGLVANTGRTEAVVFAEMVRVAGANWLRLRFDEVQLAGLVGSGQESYLRITSLLDGKWQYLNRVHVQQWRHTSAYFNGDAVLIELVARPGSGFNRLRMSEVVTGAPSEPDSRSICGSTDDRVLSYDARQGRLQPGGCTAWMIDDDCHCFLTAGHCTDSNDTVEFNVPLSSPSGNLQHPGPEDQYAIEPASLQSNGGQGEGNDWGYFGCYPNSNTGLMPVEAQGAWYATSMPPAVTDQSIRITGYGTVSSPVSPTWTQVQKTHVGPYVTFSGTLLGYQTDTTGGNSGSPVIWESTGQAIGIHTHGGCNYGDMENNGTGFNHTGLQNALANPQGVCIQQTGLKVTPAGSFTPSGNAGGPFVPASMVYTLENIGDEGFTYQVFVDAPWLSVANGSGYLAGHATAEVQIGLTDAAYLLLDGAYTDTIQFVNVTNHDGDTQRAAMLTVGGPRVIHDFPLGADPGWPTTGQWAFGQPTGQGGTQHGYPDPTSGATGPYVYGVNLSGDYSTTIGGPYHVTLGPVDLSGATSTVLKFQRWLNSDYQNYVTASIEVSTNGTSWVEVWANGHTAIAENAWSQQELDISGVADHQPAVYVRWSYQIGAGAFAYSGWNLDDVQIWGLAPVPPCRGDSNCDGVVNWRDIDFLVAAMNNDYSAWRALFAPEAPTCVFWSNDLNEDGLVSWRDIDPFVAAMNTTCP